MDAHMRRNAHVVLLMADPKNFRSIDWHFGALRGLQRRIPIQNHTKGKGMHRSLLSTACAILLCGAAFQGSAEEAAPIKIGVIADMSGIYQGNSGKGATVAVELAVEDMGGKVLGRPI